MLPIGPKPSPKFLQEPIYGGYDVLNLSTILRLARPAFFSYNENLSSSFSVQIHQEVRMGIGVIPRKR